MKNIKTFEGFFDFLKKKSKKEVKEIKDIDYIFNVDLFNKWFNAPNNGSYANPGIFLRLDKLDTGFFEEYFDYMVKNYSIEGINKGSDITEGVYHDRYIRFYGEVRIDWMKKRYKKEEGFL